MEYLYEITEIVLEIIIDKQIIITNNEVCNMYKIKTHAGDELTKVYR